MREFVGKRIEDNYEEEFTSLSEFSKKYNLDVGSLCKATKKQLVCIGGWIFKNKNEKTINLCIQHNEKHKKPYIN